MPTKLRKFIALLLKGGMVLLVLNEVRGLIMAGPVLYGLYLAGGTWAAVWVAFSALAGIAASVFVPLLIVRWVRPPADLHHKTQGA